MVNTYGQLPEQSNANSRVNSAYKEKLFMFKWPPGSYGEHIGQFSEELNKNTRVNRLYKGRTDRQIDGQTDVMEMAIALSQID